MYMNLQNRNMYNRQNIIQRDYTCNWVVYCKFMEYLCYTLASLEADAEITTGVRYLLEISTCERQEGETRPARGKMD